MARPIKNASDRRVVMIRLRVTLAEKKKLEEDVATAGLTMSDWIRLKAVDTKPLLRKPNPDKEILIRYLAAYGKIGSNLNQIARQLNRKQESEGTDMPMQIIAMVLEEVREATQQLRQILYAGYQGKN